MEDAFRWQAYYRHMGQRETGASYLTDMFTTGFPVRDKLDAQVGKWIDAPTVTVAENAPVVEAAPAVQLGSPVASTMSTPVASVASTPVVRTYRGLGQRSALETTEPTVVRQRPDVQERRDVARLRSGRHR